MFRIRIGFNVDPVPDPAFYIKADPDPAPDFGVTKMWILT
jgi:hypothetical protein